MKQFTYKEYLFAEVPEDARRFIIDMGYLIFSIMDMDKSKWITDKQIETDVKRFLETGKSKFSDINENFSIWLTTGIPLPSGQYSIIGKGDELTEEQWKEIVNGRELMEFRLHEDYENKRRFGSYFSPKNSGYSLLKSKDMKPSTTLVLHKQK